MKTKTRLLYTTWLSRQADLNGVAESTVLGEKQFAVDPSVQQVLIDKQAESSAFLGMINVVPVDEQSGEKLGLGVAGTLAGRTDTNARDRETRDPTTLDADRFECKQTNFDTHVGYAKLDLWAKFKDFQLRMRNQTLQQQARDRIMIGWNGIIAAVQTDRVANPLLQDVNIGWLQQIRVNRPTHVFAEGATPDKIVVAPTGSDYRNLDALVYDAVAKFLPEWVQGDTELVAIVGSGLLHEKYFPMVDGEDKPTEKVAADILLSKKQLGGLQAVKVPFFPAGTILVTRLDNLSIYEQEGTRRKTIVDNAKRNRVETYESVNEAYVVENYDFALLIENIEVGVEDGE
ncbi:phage capsid protein [Brevundimonas intermedia]|uniref:Phage capsid protein n=1 Tax=Brevundimonas intermedia TaxID=74315 RepID=A0ABQ5T9Y8_9CAUL|nr:phage major capsid protein, P2 family [Brevundimonas intermedia]GLK49627.1 phage capsid protein [Brevundimonas intermedia]